MVRVHDNRDHEMCRWIVMGGSWGVTLALSYAQSHPNSVAGLILRGVCLLRPQEIDWFYKQVLQNYLSTP